MHSHQTRLGISILSGFWPVSSLPTRQVTRSVPLIPVASEHETEPMSPRRFAGHLSTEIFPFPHNAKLKACGDTCDFAGILTQAASVTLRHQLKVHDKEGVRPAVASAGPGSFPRGPAGGQHAVGLCIQCAQYVRCSHGGDFLQVRVTFTFSVQRLRERSKF